MYNNILENDQAVMIEIQKKFNAKVNVEFTYDQLRNKFDQVPVCNKT